ncbi:MAG: hypothetical protein JWQ01_4648 [Massilia sp.]|nr:hypothetical protein [Massilia sp.]
MDSQFNAIDYAQQLEAAGVPPAQAEVHAKTLSLVLTNCAASRADLHALDERITARMDLFEQRITARMDAFGTKISARMDAFEAKMSARMDAFEARVELRLEKIEGRNRLLQWMAATNTAMLIAMIVKVYFP